MSSVYEIVTERIVRSLEDGVVPWRKTWKTGLPQNFVSGKVYRGVNLFLLGLLDFESPYWLTFRQCRELGGNVEKGAKGVPVIFWKPLSIDTGEKDDAGKQITKKTSILRYYTVFNLAQTTGLKAPLPDGPAQKILGCEQVIEGMPDKPTIKNHLGGAHYNPSLDEILLPDPKRFDSMQHYYSTLYHEVVHSTGHGKRLGRKGVTDPIHFGSEKYCLEELIAETGAAILCNLTGISAETEENNHAYISGWIQKIKADRKIILTAASQAQKAVDFICPG